MEFDDGQKEGKKYNMEDVIIIGAGLSGLSTAYNLKKHNLSVKILEAQDRVGGRIQTVYGKQNTPMEMGATWFARDHKNLIQLLAELNVGYFEQHNEGVALFETMSFEPPQQYFVAANTHSAYRVKGGSSRLIEALNHAIGTDKVLLNIKAVEIIDNGDHVKIVDSEQNTFYCKRLIISLPPKVVANSLHFNPELPHFLREVMQNTQTWMSGAVKFSVEYAKPFWRETGFSGSVYSQSGLASEIYDHSDAEQTKFALKGFLNGSATNYTFEQRREKVLAQLTKYYGNQAQDLISYEDKIWNDEFIQPTEDTFLPPHSNNGHPAFQDPYMVNKLFFTGTETSNDFEGYMEGAIVASKAVSTRILNIFRNQK